MPADEDGAADDGTGYAKEMSDAYKARQAALLAQACAKADIIITTALIRGGAVFEKKNKAIIFFL